MTFKAGLPFREVCSKEVPPLAFNLHNFIKMMKDRTSVLRIVFFFFFVFKENCEKKKSRKWNGNSKKEMKDLNE